MSGRDIIVIGASTGGLEVLRQIVRQLPADFPAAVFVVVHIAPDNPGLLPGLLDRAGPLPAEHAVDGEPVRTGRIYVAPADHHLLVMRGVVRVTRGPKENGFRPAVDPLFRTAAKAYSVRVIGVVLSGGLDDGTFGLTWIKEAGGVAIVQNPEEAMVASMPLSALRHVAVDHVVPVAGMASLLARLVAEPVTEGAEAMALSKKNQPDIAEKGAQSLRHHTLPGPPSKFTCPDCGGAVWELNHGELTRFRCHTGHSYTATSLLAAQHAALDEPMWSVLRALEEHAELHRQLSQQARERGQKTEAREYEQQAVQVESRAKAVRDLLLKENALLTPQRQDEEVATSGIQVSTAVAKDPAGPVRRRAGRNGSGTKR